MCDNYNWAANMVTYSVSNMESALTDPELGTSPIVGELSAMPALAMSHVPDGLYGPLPTGNVIRLQISL